MTKICAIIQTRMNSKRLPGKVLLPIHKKTMLDYVIKQVSASKKIDKIIIATTRSSKDKPIVEYCLKNSISYYRGSTNDVLDRYYNCAKKFSCQTIVRISSDCPLIDPKIIDQTVTLFLKNSFDYISNNIEKKKGKWENSLCKFPQGMVVEISSFKILEKAWNEAKKPSEREHVYPYVQFNSKKFTRKNIMSKKDLSFIRCTVDKKEDLDFVRKLVTKIKNKNKVIHISDILKVIKDYPDLVKINNKINFDEGYNISLEKDKKLSNKCQN